MLVIDGSGWLRPVLLGDMIVAKALVNVSGFRDLWLNHHMEELGAMDLGVQALAIYPMKTEKKGNGNLYSDDLRVSNPSGFYCI